MTCSADSAGEGLGRYYTEYEGIGAPRGPSHTTRITSAPVTRGQARAIEQALIARNPGFENKINSISPKHSWYNDAVEWGEAWLKANGY